MLAHFKPVIRGQLQGALHPENPGDVLRAQLIDKIHDRRCLVNSFIQPESRFNKLLRTFPLYAVVHERTGLLGTREYAIRLLGQPSMIKAAAAA